jgi:hypothetical protein
LTWFDTLSREVVSQMIFGDEDPATDPHIAELAPVALAPHRVDRDAEFDRGLVVSKTLWQDGDGHAVPPLAAASTWPATLFGSMMVR